ncbi:flagellar basal-body MS-ring/collar protein FliF [Chengkuizengella axinellae]|uniref:Flagellar basal-body MS-ring/collar protein FliF n=1 Tax=Chengkuizengella axinellae TaxID=3064388 RepID=A0ABT9IWF9_9BACL|nr:flagellar basal-body MS-ring/collar protein FliF [Chengkuizengella sp. 2205SS18-9]MDP5273437.1 flagellar basal-body MS-ring/collar protein FliF [Chengkuizengella sp. 2205SS18-9]
MNETISRYWGKVLQFWKQISLKQKIMIGILFLVTLLTLIIVIYNLSKTEYSLAYTELTQADAASIKEYLDSNNIPYQFSSDLKSVGVPSTYLTDVKLAVASQDLIVDGSQGFDIFKENMSSFGGITEGQFEILNTDARAGEIEQLINAIDGVNWSKVVLNLPEESVFISSTGTEDQAYASGIISFKRNYRIEQPLIDTIYNLVRTSVRDLPLENITISSDLTGELLPSSRTDGGSGVQTGAAVQQMQIKKQYELEIQRNVQNFLKQIFIGDEHIAVNVFSTLNFDQINQQEIRFEPIDEDDKKGIVRSIEEIEKSYTGEDNPSGGITGTGDNNIPNYVGNNNNSLTNEEESESRINYEIDEITSSIIKSPYVVQDLTISVSIPSLNDSATATGGQPQTNPLSDEVKKLLVNIVSASLADSGKQFTEEQIAQKVTVISRPSDYQVGGDIVDPPPDITWMYLVGGAAALALVAGGAYTVYRRRQNNVLFDQEQELAYTAEKEVPNLEIPRAPVDDEVKNQLEHLARSKPEEFVKILRTWLADE